MAQFGDIRARLSALEGWWDRSERFQSSPFEWPVRSLKHNHIKNRLPTHNPEIFLDGKVDNLV